MPPLFPARTCLPAMLALCLAACHGGGGKLDAAGYKAIVMQEAPKAIVIAAGAVSGTELQGEGKWASCMAYPVWKYGGWARFSGPEGDREAQLAAIRTALVQAGYADITQVKDKVSVQRGEFVFTIGRGVPTREGLPQWSASFSAGPCSRYSARERKHIKANEHVREPLALPRRAEPPKEIPPPAPSLTQ